MSSRMNGLDELQRQLKEAQCALNSLDDTMDDILFDPDHPQSVQGTLGQMEAAIDRKIALYRDNPLVSHVSRELKDQFRKQILKRSRTTQAE